MLNCVSIAVQAQQLIINTTTYVNPTPAQSLVQNVLLGPGVSASNFTFVGSPGQIGFFKSIATNLGLDSGIVMSSGEINDLPQNAGILATTGFGSAVGDPDLAVILNNSPIPTQGVNDVAILEFDFIPTGDSIRFDYVFASEEYPDFVCDFNDVFGLFLSGPGINGPYSNGAENIALVPGTGQEVSITTINNGDSNGSCGWAPQNAQYYVDNSASNAIAFDAFTTVLTAQSTVICGQTYHVKMAVADAGDFSYDSGIFLKARSFLSSSVAVQAATVAGDSTLVEGCASGQFIFSRPGNAADTLILPIAISGTAINGVDYAPINDTVTFLPGENFVNVDVTPLTDGLVEGIEDITITFTQFFCGSTNNVTTSLYIVPPSPLSALINGPDTIGCPGENVTLTASILGGYPPYNVSWSNGDTLQSTTIFNVTTDTLVCFYVSDLCTNQNDTVCQLIIGSSIAQFTVNVDDVVIDCPGSPAILTAIVSGGGQPYNYQWTDAFGNFIGFASTVSVSPAQTTEYILTVFENCSFQSLSDTVTVIVSPLVNLNILTLTSDTTLVEGCADANILFTLPAPIQDTLNLVISIGGTTSPQDFLSNVPGTVTFLPGDDTLSYTLTALQDVITEGPETIVISFIQSLCGSLDTVSVTASIVPAQQVTLSLPDTLNVNCPGDLITITGVPSGGYPPYIFDWDNGSTNDSIAVTPINDATFCLTVIDGCSLATVTECVFVNVPSTAPFTVNVADGEIVCPGDPDTLVALVSGGFSPYTYQWVQGATTIGTNPSTIQSPAATTTYTIIVNDACGSLPVQAQAIINVLPYTLPSINLVTPDDIICAGDDIQILANTSAGRPPYSYFWEGATQGSPDSTYSYSSSVNNFVLCRVQDACGTFSPPDSLFYNIPAYTTIEASSIADTLVCPGSVLSFTGTATGGAGVYTYAWTISTGPGQLTSTTGATADVTMDGSTLFLLTVTDQCGNIGTEEVNINVFANCEVQEFNVITPNGDDKNQKLVFKNVEFYPNNKLSIFNRWGKEVFVADGYKNDWEGGDLSAGTYYYSLDLGNGEPARSGFFKLIR